MLPLNDDYPNDYDLPLEPHSRLGEFLVCLLMGLLIAAGILWIGGTR